MKQTNPEKFAAFGRLVRRVSLVDPDAAQYLLRAFVASVSGRKYLYPSFFLCGAISGVLMWSDTEQGDDYWRNIQKKLSVLA